MQALTAVFLTPPTGVQVGISMALVCPTWRYLISRSVPTVTYVRRRTGVASTKLDWRRELIPCSKHGSEVRILNSIKPRAQPEFLARGLEGYVLPKIGRTWVPVGKTNRNWLDG